MKHLQQYKIEPLLLVTCVIGLCWQPVPICAQDKAQPYNVLMIMVDDLNDWVGFLDGHPQGDTPNMNKLATEGLTFERAYTAAPACNPSRVAIFTGYRPSTTGVYKNAHYMRNAPLLKEAVTLPEYFAQHGYFTTARGKLFHRLKTKWAEAETWEHYHFPQGDQMIQHPEKSAERLAGGLSFNPNGGNNFDWGDLSVPLEETMDFQTASWAAEELRKEHDRPFFIACGIFKPHLPWYLPGGYRDAFPIEQLDMPKVNPDDLDDIPSYGQAISQGLDENHDYQRLKRHGLEKEAVQAYLASMKYADDCVGIVLKALEQSAYRDNTIILLIGDHGWHFGEKLHYRKFSLWEESCRVPFVLRVPGITRPGSRSSRLVNLVDIFPTLTDLCGLPSKVDNDGVSLKPLLRKPNRKWHRYNLTTLDYQAHSVITKRWRYIRYPDGSEELYDHRRDPLEWKNLARKRQFQSKKKKLQAKFPIINAPAVKPEKVPSYEIN